MDPTISQASATMERAKLQTLTWGLAAFTSNTEIEALTHAGVKLRSQLASAWGVHSNDKSVRDFLGKDYTGYVEKLTSKDFAKKQQAGKKEAEAAEPAGKRAAKVKVAPKKRCKRRKGPDGAAEEAANPDDLAEEGSVKDDGTQIEDLGSESSEEKPDEDNE